MIIARDGRNPTAAINPRYMHKGHGSLLVCVAICVLFLQMQWWNFLKTHCSKVMVTVADHLGLLHLMTNSQCTKETAMAV